MEVQQSNLFFLLTILITLKEEVTIAQVRLSLVMIPMVLLLNKKWCGKNVLYITDLVCFSKDERNRMNSSDVVKNDEYVASIRINSKYNNHPVASWW